MYNSIHMGRYPPIGRLAYQKPKGSERAPFFYFSKDKQKGGEER